MLKQILKNKYRSIDSGYEKYSRTYAKALKRY